MNRQLKKLLYVSMLTAVEVVLSRFCSVSTQFGKLGFSFAPLAVCGMLFGPWWGCLAGGLSDVIGAVLFPIGPYFPGFTVSNALTGLVFGLFLPRHGGWRGIIPAAAVNNLVISLLLSTWWLHLLYGSPYLGLLPQRLVQAAVMTVLECVVIRVLEKPMRLYVGNRMKLN